MSSARRENPRHLPELDGIRGLAILGVLIAHIVLMGGIVNGTSPAMWEQVLLHSASILGGGVDLLFVLSGFLITGILLRTKQSENYFSSFYIRRMLRIFPIYYLTLTASVLVGERLAAFGNLLPAWTSWRIAYFLYLQNWPLFWHGEKVMSGMWGVYWSLAVEEQFYLIWPLVILYFSNKIVFRICAIGVPLAILLRVFLYYAYFGNNFGLLQLTSSRVEGLLLGAMCAVFMNSRQTPLPMRWIVASGTTGTVLLLAIGFLHPEELLAVGKWFELLGPTSFALISLALVAASQHPFPRFKKILTQPWLRSFGKFSYGMYVYHLILIFAIRHYVVNGRTPTNGSGIPYSIAVKASMILAEIGAVYLLAKLSFDVVETRFLRLKPHFEPQNSVISGRKTEERVL